MKIKLDIENKKQCGLKNDREIYNQSEDSRKTASIRYMEARSFYGI